MCKLVRLKNEQLGWTVSKIAQILLVSQNCTRTADILSWGLCCSIVAVVSATGEGILRCRTLPLCEVGRDSGKVRPLDYTLVFTMLLVEATADADSNSCSDLNRSVTPSHVTSDTPTVVDIAPLAHTWIKKTSKPIKSNLLK